MLGHQRNQALTLTLGHQRQKRLVADHQRMALQQRLQRCATPELARGVVGVGDPQHRRRGGIRRGRGSSRVPIQWHWRRLHGSTPTAQSPAVIHKAGLGQQRGAQRGGIAGRPGEQLSGPIAGQHQRRLQTMQHGDRLAQALRCAIGVGLQRRLPSGPAGPPRQAKRCQGGTGIEHLARTTAEAPGRGLQIAAVGFRHGAPPAQPPA